jgi:hypothetical protein
VVYVEAGDDKTILACAEEGLRHCGRGAVVARTQSDCQSRVSLHAASGAFFLHGRTGNISIGAATVAASITAAKREIVPRFRDRLAIVRPNMTLAIFNDATVPSLKRLTLIQINCDEKKCQE